MYTLQVCSLLVIPPPIGRMVPQGGFPADLTKLNLLGWADLVQDMAVGLQVLPPRLSLDLGSQVIALLQLLEAATVGFCHHCCHLRPHCMCTGASQPAPSTSWSQVVQQAPGYGVTSSRRGVTNLSTSMGGMPGYVVPPPGLIPPDFSIWSIPPQEAPLPPGLLASLLYWPPMGRATQMRATIERHAQVLWAQALQAPLLLRWCHPCASHSHPPGVRQQPHTSRWCNCQVSLRGGESPSTPLPINFWPWAVKMLMVVGGREPKAEMITPSPARGTHEGSLLG